MSMDLPKTAAKIALKGNPAQQKWANQIRSKKAQQLQMMTPRVIALAMRPHLREEDFSAMGATTFNHMASFVHAVCQHALSCPEASWWITHRDTPVHEWIIPSMRASVEHYSKTKPFR
jgi:hypothetical protein